MVCFVPRSASYPRNRKLQMKKFKKGFFTYNRIRDMMLRAIDNKGWDDTRLEVI